MPTEYSMKCNQHDARQEMLNSSLTVCQGYVINTYKCISYIYQARHYTCHFMCMICIISCKTHRNPLKWEQ